MAAEARMGLMGPSGGDPQLIREGIEFLLGPGGVDEILYLGDDEDILRASLSAWSEDRLEGPADEDAFLDRAAELVARGTAAQIESLLEADADVQRLRRVRKLPPPPTRAIELIAGRILIAVHDKAILDEDDIANAELIVYGRAEKAGLRRFGPRYFLTPGPLTERCVATLEVEDAGAVAMTLWSLSGEVRWREIMARKSAKVSVS